MSAQLIQTIAVYALPMIFAITLHEAAHGYAALRFGDRTALLQGRISLNPARHIDPVGTILLPLAILVMGELTKTQLPIFGWAKPVPFESRNFKDPKRAIGWVALAGPLANIVMMLLWVLVLNLYYWSNIEEVFIHDVAIAGIVVNISLAALNLIPIPPLDGGRVLMTMLPTKAAQMLANLEPYGMMILILLMATDSIALFMQPFVIPLKLLASALIFQ